jgi:hypothetical protein
MVNCVNLKRTIRVVYLLKNTGYAVLFSTDTELDALTLYRYYKARFQIEFLFRDAKRTIDGNIALKITKLTLYPCYFTRSPHNA